MARLTDQQKKVLPPELRMILERFNHEPKLLMKLKQMLLAEGNKIQQQSLNHETFCNTFSIPKTLPKELLKLYGIPERELKQSVKKIGFEINGMYMDIYYITLVIAYLIGLEFDDENIRRLSLLLIDIRIWNGRRIKAFPQFCDDDTARYVLNYALKGNHTLKIHGSAFEYLDKKSVPEVDAKYSKTIPNNLGSKTEGLRKLIETNFSRYVQLFRSVKDKYYKAKKEGTKEIISGQYKNQYGTGDLVEARESFSSNIERLVDKIQKNAMFKRNILNSKESKDFFKDEFSLSEAALKNINNWFEEEDNQEEIKYYYELLFTSTKPKNEGDICKFDIQSLAKKVSSAKKDPELLKAKEVINHALQSIMGSKFNTLGTQSLHRTRYIVAHAFAVYMKLLLCKKL